MPEELPIVFACVSGNMELIEQRLKNGQDINYCHPKKGTALTQASYRGNLQLVKYLLENGADIDLPDQDGYTALHLAAYWDALDVALFLIESGADPNVKDPDGKTALDHSHYEQLDDAIVAHGGNSTTPPLTQAPYDIKAILAAPTPREGLNAMHGALAKAVLTGKYRMTEVEKTVFSIVDAQSGVYCDGFGGYLFNGNEFTLLEARDGLHTIGSAQAKEIYDRALLRLRRGGIDIDGDFSTDAAFHEVLETCSTDLKALDILLYDAEEDVDALLFTWLRGQAEHELP